MSGRDPRIRILNKTLKPYGSETPFTAMFLIGFITDPDTAFCLNKDPDIGSWIIAYLFIGLIYL
jgi:hypothetical protein